MNAICERIEAECVVTPIAWEGIIPALNTGKIDMREQRRELRLRFTSNVEDEVEAGPEHPLRFVIDPRTQGPSPYVHLRTNLEALIHRNVFYQLVELAVSREIDGQRWLGVWSGGEFFRIGLEP